MGEPGSQEILQGGMEKMSGKDYEDDDFEDNDFEEDSDEED